MGGPPDGLVTTRSQITLLPFQDLEELSDPVFSDGFIRKRIAEGLSVSIGTEVHRRFRVCGGGILLMKGAMSVSENQSHKRFRLRVSE